ncbi:hypothetical protein BSLG_008774 [Batrachochytrium salamandrivorans]|nr:hypothetical protein BSLG_008774 [Batrachochytrium salamandrivorans]
MVPGVAQPGMGFKAQRMPKALPPALPQPTLYVRNLRETRNLTALRTALTTVFSKYGDIVEIKVKRNLAHRGQAFVSFKDVTSASKAKEEVHGFPLFNRPMDIQYAREQSFAVSALTGSVEEHKRKRKELIAEREAMEANDPSKKKRKTNTEDILPPNSILFIQSLPPDVSDEALSTLFKQFHGFKEVRLVPGRNDIAFVEYDNEMQSALAKQALHGHRMSPKDEEIKVTFAKK